MVSPGVGGRDVLLTWCAETAILVLTRAGPHVILCYLECSGIPRQVHVHQNSGYLFTVVTGSQQPLQLTV